MRCRRSPELPRSQTISRRESSRETSTWTNLISSGLMDWRSLSTWNCESNHLHHSCVLGFYTGERRRLSSLWLALARRQARFGKAFYPDPSVSCGRSHLASLHVAGTAPKVRHLTAGKHATPCRSLGIIYHLFHLSKHGYGRVESAAENMFTRSSHWPWLHLVR